MDTNSNGLNIDPLKKQNKDIVEIETLEIETLGQLSTMLGNNTNTAAEIGASNFNLLQILESKMLLSVKFQEILGFLEAIEQNKDKNDKLFTEMESFKQIIKDCINSLNTNIDKLNLDSQKILQEENKKITKSKFFTVIGLIGLTILNNVNGKKLNETLKNIKFFKQNKLDDSTAGVLHKLESTNPDISQELDKKCPYIVGEAYLSIDNNNCRTNLIISNYNKEFDKVNEQLTEFNKTQENQNIKIGEHTTAINDITKNITNIDNTVNQLNKITTNNTEDIKELKEIIKQLQTSVEELLKNQTNNGTNSNDDILLKRSINSIFKAFGKEQDLFKANESISLQEIDNAEKIISDKISKTDQIQYSLIGSLMCVVGSMMIKIIVQDRVANGIRGTFIVGLNALFGNKNIAANKNKMEQTLYKNITLSFAEIAKNLGLVDDKGEVIQSKKKDFAKFVQKTIALISSLELPSDLINEQTNIENKLLNTVKCQKNIQSIDNQITQKQDNKTKNIANKGTTGQIESSNKKRYPTALAIIPNNKTHNNNSILTATTERILRD